MDLESTATMARPKTKSLRATIPEGIVSYLDLESGDKIEWKMDSDHGKRIVVVRKGKK
jgi:bifunctional DNA-binding transcriptional regulator/antitoxin component of YhaV-PrlF toxin-antitoxin module